MDINERIEKYLTEGDKKSDYEKVKKVIASAKTDEQLITALKMMKNWTTKYDNEAEGMAVFAQMRRGMERGKDIDHILAKKIHVGELDDAWLKDFNKKYKEVVAKMKD